MRYTGGAEAFFSFVDASAWHLYLGEKEPREKRIIASLFRLFESNSYFMLDANKLALGSWVGFDEHWKFGPLKITLEAWIEGNAVISWNPVHFYGDLWLHGKAELKIFWFGLGMTVDARLAADIFDPFHLLAELKVGIDLPWFLPDFDISLNLEWGPEPIIPPLPLPLKEISVEHFKVTTSCPLSRGFLLLPNYDSNNDGYLDDPQGPEQPPDLNKIPVVPLDCRPHITFERPINDDAEVGLNIQPCAEERIGDPEKGEGPVLVRYGLKEVVLEKHLEDSWTPIAWAPNSDKDKKLYGSWAPMPAAPDNGGQSVSQTKLWIWSKTPFDYTRHGGRAWDEWFTDRFSQYPCVPIPQDQEICYDFEEFDTNLEFTSPLAHPDEPKLIFYWDIPPKQIIKQLEYIVHNRKKGLSFPCNIEGEVNSLNITLPKPAKRFILIIAGSIDWTRFTGYDDKGNPFSNYNKIDSDVFALEGKGITNVLLEGYVRKDTRIVAICVTVGPDDSERLRIEMMNKHLVDEIERWSQEDNVLEPYTSYRLKVVTSIKAKGDGELAGYSKDSEQVEYAYFRTEGPIGLMNKDNEKDNSKRGFEDLTPYIRQTI